MQGKDEIGEEGEGEKENWYLKMYDVERLLKGTSPALLIAERQ